jgi:hypothetical protein
MFVISQPFTSPFVKDIKGRLANTAVIKMIYLKPNNYIIYYTLNNARHSFRMK